MNRAWRTAGSWAAALALVGGAAVLTAITPAEHAVEVPFTVGTSVGTEGVARNIAVTVHDVRFTTHVSGRPANAAMGGEWSATGTWLVVDLDAAAVVDQSSAMLAFATLEADGATFSASERMTSFLNEQLVPGVPKRGVVVFELPASLHRGPAVLSFATRPDSRLDSIVQVPVDLARVRSAPSVEIPAAVWSER